MRCRQLVNIKLIIFLLHLEEHSETEFNKTSRFNLSTLTGIPLWETLLPCLSDGLGTYLDIKSNQIKSNQIKSNRIESNQIKSNQDLRFFVDLCMLAPCFSLCYKISFLIYTPSLHHPIQLLYPELIYNYCIIQYSFYLLNLYHLIQFEMKITKISWFAAEYLFYSKT